MILSVRSSLLLILCLGSSVAACSSTLPPPVPESELGNLVSRAETAGSEARVVSEEVKKVYQEKRSQIDDARALYARAQAAQSRCEELVDAFHKKQERARKAAAAEAAKKIEEAGPKIDIDKYSPSDAPTH